MITLAILVPSPLGFHLFIRWPRDRLRRSSTLVHPTDLAEVLRPLGHPLVVGLVGARNTHIVLGTVLAFADLIAIPEAWLRGVPRGDVRARAHAAARLVAAHREAPLTHYRAAESARHRDDLPF